MLGLELVGQALQYGAILFGCYLVVDITLSFVVRGWKR